MDPEIESGGLAAPAPSMPAPQADAWLLRAGQEAPPVPVAPRIDPSVLVSMPADQLYAAIAEASQPEALAWDGSYSKRRAEFRYTFSYAIPSRDAVKGVAAFAGSGGICEIGAGRALWARLLRDEGVHVDATDYAITDDGMSNEKAGYFDESPHLFHPVRREYARRAAAATDAKTLMMIWPPYGNVVAALSLAAFRGDQLVYIGEGRGGCTGDKSFFDQLEAGWERVGEIDIPRWETLHDSVELYRRRQG